MKIGEHVLIASPVSITSGRHQHGDASGGVHYGDRQLAGVTIGGRSWIGEGALVLANVDAECIIGAGAVVVKDVRERSLAVGNPALPRPR